MKQQQKAVSERASPAGSTEQEDRQSVGLLSRRSLLTDYKLLSTGDDRRAHQDTC